MGLGNLFKKKSMGQVGLDIGSYSTKLVRLEDAGGGKKRLTALGFRELGKGTIVDKEVKDDEGLVYTIQGLISELDPDISEIIISLAGNKVFYDRFTVATTTKKEKELVETVMTEIEQRIPTGTDNLALDYQVLGVDTKKKQSDILMIAVYSDFLKKYIDVLEAAGFTTIAVDADYFALYNAFEKNYTIPSEGVLALVNIGHTLTNLTIIVDGQFNSVRDIAVGCRDLWEHLQREMQLSTDELVPLMRGSAEWIDAEKLKNSIFVAVDDIKFGIDRAFAYFESASGGRRVDKLFISGGGAIIPYVPEALSTKFDLPCEVIDPFKEVEIDPAVFNYGTPESVGPLFAIAVGLALKEV